MDEWLLFSLMIEEFRRNMPKSEAEDLCSNDTLSNRPEFPKAVACCSRSVSYWE